MISKVIFEQGDHRWIVFGRDPERPESVVDTNQYLVTREGTGTLLDPGGLEIFSHFLAALSDRIELDKIKAVFSSHQDPDICSSLPMWFDLCPNTSVYTSWLWTTFMSHFFLGKTQKLQPVPDQGAKIPIGDTRFSLLAVPAHYCHSSGNFSIFDPEAKILFSGDIGAALLPHGESPLFVKDFAEHVKYMDTFHRRWMPSAVHLRSWVRRVRALEPSMICPQHGTIFAGENVGLLLDWLEHLEVGQVTGGAAHEEPAGRSAA